MLQNFDDFFNYNERQLMDDLSAVIEIESVALGNDGHGNPFGPKVTSALNNVLECASAKGFQTCNIDNYIGEITYGTGEKMIGILCHVDIVDAGAGWDTPPFQMLVKNGEIYGRGVIDDKGPMVCCIYAMKYIKDNELLPKNCKIKMIIGTDEEENWISIKEYLKRKPVLPDISIVPDASFPVVYCEKGLVNFSMDIPIKDSNYNNKLRILELKGGERPNVVAGNAKCLISTSGSGIEIADLEAKIKSIADSNDIAVETILNNSGDLEIMVTGRAAHAMTPEKGKNAISYLMKLLYDLGTEVHGGFVQQDALKIYEKLIGLEYDGTSMVLKCSDEASGSLTFNLGLIEMNESSLRLSINLRYPASMSFDCINEKLIRIVKSNGLSIDYGVCMDPIFYDIDSQLIKELMAIYRECTGDLDTVPVSLGGATYARAITNAVAFGPVFPWQAELAHEPNEHCSVSDLRMITKIYQRAIIRLGTLIQNGEGN